MNIVDIIENLPPYDRKCFFKEMFERFDGDQDFQMELYESSAFHHELLEIQTYNDVIGGILGSADVLVESIELQFKEQPKSSFCTDIVDATGVQFSKIEDMVDTLVFDIEAGDYDKQFLINELKTLQNQILEVK